MADAIPSVENFDVAQTQAGVLSGKDAALRAVATGGSAGLQAMLAGQAAMAGQASQAALSAAQNVAGVQGPMAPAGFAQQEAQRATAGFDPLQRASQAQAEAGNQFSNLLSVANTNYGNQVAAAVPVVHQQTQRELNSLTARAKEGAAERAQARQLADLQLTNARESRADAAAERAARAAGRGDEAAMNQIQLERAKVGLESDKLSLAKQVAGKDGPQLTDNDMRSISALSTKTQAAFDKAYSASLYEKSGGKYDEAGKPEKDPEGYKAVMAMVNEGISLEAALGRFKTPQGKPLSAAKIQEWYEDYQRGLQRELETVPGYFDLQDALRRQRPAGVGGGGVDG